MGSLAGDVAVVGHGLRHHAARARVVSIIQKIIILGVGHLDYLKTRKNLEQFLFTDATLRRHRSTWCAATLIGSGALITSAIVAAASIHRSLITHSAMDRSCSGTGWRRAMGRGMVQIVGCSVSIDVHRWIDNARTVWSGWTQRFTSRRLKHLLV